MALDTKSSYPPPPSYILWSCLKEPLSCDPRFIEISEEVLARSAVQ
jgi:hypothetical protein